MTCMKFMKILHFTDSLRSGGKERQLIELLKGLSSGKDKDIVCELAVMSRDVHYTALNSLNVKVHYLIRNKKKDARSFLKLFKLCKEVKPDIIHTWNSMTSVYAMPIATIFGISLVNGMIRDAPSKLGLFGKEWIRSKLTFPFSDVIVSNSYAGLNSYKVTSRKGACIHNGFDSHRIKNLRDKETVRRKFSISTEKVVGMVASFSNNKDYETFISAAQMALKKRDDVTFLAIGDGEKLEKCKKLVRPRFQSKVKFLGKQQDVESIVNIFDIGVLATYSEGISNSIIEYMALGKPVVATKCEGTKELVPNGKTGFLVKPHDVEDMCKRIGQLLEDNKLTSKMGKAGRERIEKHFNLEKMTNAFIELYGKLIGKKSCSSLRRVDQCR